MNFYFLDVVIVLIIYQVGYVGPNQVPVPQQPPCPIGQHPPPQVPPVPVQPQAPPLIPPNSVQHLQQQCVPQQWPQQPPFNPEYTKTAFLPQPEASHLGQQGMLHQPPYPPQYPQPYTPPSGYSQPPVVYPGGGYPPVPGAYPGVYPVQPVYPAGCCNPIPVSQSTQKPVCWEGSGKSSEETKNRRVLVWCTCNKCKSVVPLLLGGDKDNIASFGHNVCDNPEPKFPLSKRIRTKDRPKVNIEFRQHNRPGSAVRKVFMLFY